MRIRKRLFVDQKVQGTLMLRAVEYWFCCVLTVGFALLVWNLVTGSGGSLSGDFVEAWHYFLVAGVVSLLLLPVLIYDALKVSNRFTGPLYRLRRELRRLAAGERVPPVRFRSRDFWLDLADEFNAVAERMEMLEDRAEDFRKAAAVSQQMAGESLQPRPRTSEKKSGNEDTSRSKFGSASNGLNLPDQLVDLPRNPR